MIYLSGFRFPDRAQEANYMAFSPRARQTCYDSYYPFGLFEGRTLPELDFLEITILYGGNGSGKMARRTLPANVRTRSNGESALAVFSERIREDALYLLDEPENSLSPERQLELAQFLHDSARFYNCQFIIATHSPFLLAMPGARVYDLDAEPVTTRKWTELENVKATWEFFQRHRNEFK